jgi:hypothetical protein
MKSHWKKFFLVLGLAGQLFILGQTPAKAEDTLTKQELLLSIPDPVQNITLLARFSLVNEDEVVGAVDVYDDPGTERPGDYLEISNSSGDVLALVWFDRFGIERTAIDRGLLEAPQKLEGVFVILFEGEPL